jgi:RIO kinase 1
VNWILKHFNLSLLDVKLLLQRNKRIQTMNTEYNFQNFDDDPHEDYAALFDPVRIDRKTRRKRSPKPNHKPKVTRDQVMERITDELGWENAFQTSYRPSKYEAEWLFDSLRPLFEQSLISDVLSLVKGGKEASVYCCAAHPTMDEEWLAAKVYRPRKFRGLTNDKIYREGRDILTEDGHVVHENKDRVVRAIGKKTTFGQQVSHTSWLMHEYQALEVLYQAGGNVPKPYLAGSNVILMSFIGVGLAAATTLNTVRLDKVEATQIFDLVLENVELMLKHDLIHADLSAYNILYIQGKITIIDFPQVVDPHRNRNAPAILARDIQQTCDYFKKQGVNCDAQVIYKDLWQRYLRVPSHILRADESRLAQFYPEIFGGG